MTSWRVVIVTRILPVALGFHAALREAGHEPVALLTVRDTDGRYGGPVVIEVLGDALANLAAGVEPTAQEGGDYQTFFGDDDALLDFSHPAAEVHRLVWAWRFTIPSGELHAALAELNGETVRVLASSLTEVEDARRVECADAPLWLVATEPATAP